MSTLFWAVCSASVGGSVLFVLAYLICRLLKRRLEPRGHFLLWLLVIVRFATLFGIPGGLLNMAGSWSVAAPAQHTRDAGNLLIPGPAQDAALSSAPTPFRPADMLGVLWFVMAAVLLAVRISRHAAFMHRLRQLEPSRDLRLLNTLAQCLEETGLKRMPEVVVSALVTVPCVAGIWRPYVLLPSRVWTEQDLRNIFRHELMHLRRWDLLTLWLSAAAVCLQWFNPLAYAARSRLLQAGERACDESVLALGRTQPQAYAETLLEAARPAAQAHEPGVLTMARKGELRARLEAIVMYREKTTTGRRPLAAIAAAGLTAAALLLGSCADPMEIHPTADPVPIASVSKWKESRLRSNAAAVAEEAYASGNLPMFTLGFADLDAGEQQKWLRRLYTEDAVAFYGAAVDEADIPLDAAEELAAQFYGDGNAAFFSMTMARLPAAQLETWYARAEADGSLKFMSMLSEELGWAEKYEAVESQWEQAAVAEYLRHGIACDDQGYLFEDQRVRLLLDQAEDSSCYRLHLDPAGVISIRVLRDPDGEVQQVLPVSAAEEAQILTEFGED